MRYPCRVTRVIDGDTVCIEASLGFGLINSFRGRLLNLNAPETRTRDLEEKARGFKAKKYLEKLCDSHVLEVDVTKQDKYGRWLVVLFAKQSKDSAFTNINEMLIQAGHAIKKSY